MRTCWLWEVDNAVSYDQGLRLQQQARTVVAVGECDGIIIFLEHTPVITIGRDGGTENLLATEQWLQASGAEVAKTNRGGNITCHNPGQLVCYPILQLGRWQQDVHWYARCLEEVIIGVLSRYGLRAGRKQRYTGVWYENSKVAAIGLSVRNWITGHGLALNVNNDLTLFQAIVPCGIGEFGVTSLQQAGIETTVNEVRQRVAQEFAKQFACRLVRRNDDV